LIANAQTHEPVITKETTKDVKVLHWQKGNLWVATSRSVIVYDRVRHLT
jgi:hypothetical protein